METQTHSDLRALYGAQHFVVMLPKTMQFTADSGSGFQSMQDPRRSDVVVQITSNTQTGQPLAFKVSGTGTLVANDQQEVGSDQTSAGDMTGSDSRPRGGLGLPY